MSDNEKILDRIKKLFNLAYNGGDTESHEAQTALLMAQKLMAEHNIEQSVVMSNNEDFIPTKKSVVQGSVFDGTRIAWWRGSLGVIISNNFKCECYTEKRKIPNSIMFFGLKDDVILAKIAYDFASEAIDSTCRLYLKKYKTSNAKVDTAGIRNDFISGWLKGLKDQFAEQIEKHNWGLVLVKDALVVQAKEKLNLKKGNKSRVKTNHNQEAKAEGYNTGKNFNISAKRLA